MNKHAFTLAEVLITIAIIGVIAAITIPVLMNNIEARKYRTQLTKTFSTLSQAVKTSNGVYEATFAYANKC